MSEARAVARNGVAKPSTLALVSAFAAVYVLWGSTYLGIRFSMETLPPFFTQGVRFGLAGVVLYAWARARGEATPTRREWGGATITGALLFVAGSGGLVWAEHFIPSGVAALVVATEPMSFVLLEAMRRRRRPHGVVLAGLALGTAGLLVLVGPGMLFGGERFHLGACLVLVVGTFAWAWGSLFSRGSRLPSTPLMATAATLLTGGALLALVGVFAGELGRFDPSAVSTKSIVATSTSSSSGRSSASTPTSGSCAIRPLRACRRTRTSTPSSPSFSAGSSQARRCRRAFSSRP